MNKDGMFNDNFDIDYVKEYITNSSPETKIYIGCDSQRIRKRKAKIKTKGLQVRYTVVVIVHTDGKHGAKIFGYSEMEQVIDANIGKPINKLMLEVQKIVEIYEHLADVLIDREHEIHLDINSKKEEGSHIAANAAIGWILGTTGIKPKLKPDAFASSFAADHYVKNKNQIDNKTLPKPKEEV